MRIWPWFATLCFARFAAAETLAVLPVSGVNVHEGTLEAAQDVLRGQLGRRGVGTVVIPGVPGRFEVDGQTAAENARHAGADGAAVLHVTRLGSRARLRLSVYTAAGQPRFVDELPAATPDDMQPALERLAGAYVSGRPAAGNAEIDTVTAAESAPHARRRATSMWGLMLGAVFPAHLDDARAAPGGSLFWLYDARSFLAEVAIGVHAGDAANQVSLGLGVYHPFGRGDTTPYLGGGLRWAAASYREGESGSGIQLYGAAGLLLGRLSTVQIRVQLEYFVNTFEASEEAQVAHGAVAGLGIAF